MNVTNDLMDPITCYLRIGNSAIAFEVTGEIIETVDYYSDGTPDWSTAGVCDFRGAGGREGYVALGRALEAAEENANLAGYDIVRVPVPS